jgi:capsular polysaccharide transport system permease protein
LGSICALSLGAFGVGVVLGIIREFLPALSHVLNMPNRFLYWTSGVFFLPDSMPPTFRTVMSWNPLMHGITLFREGYYPMYSSHLLDVGYLLKWCIVSVLLAFSVEKLARKQLRNLIG